MAQLGYPCAALADGIKCTGVKNCKTCGFNPEEAEIRKKYVQIYGLTTNADQKRQLIMTSERRAKIMNGTARPASGHQPSSSAGIFFTPNNTVREG